MARPKNAIHECAVPGCYCGNLTDKADLCYAALAWSPKPCP